MRKFIFSIVAMFISVAMFAQRTTVEGSKVFDNTYVGVSVGGQLGMTNFSGENSWNVAPFVGLSYGKWVTPAFGFELNGDVVLHDGFSVRNRFVDATYVGLNGRLNVNNLVHPYRANPDRVEFIPFVGFGWLHGFGTVPTLEDGIETLDDELVPETPVVVYGNVPTVQHVGPNGLASKVGVDVAVNLGENRNWVLNVRPSVLYALTGAYTGNHNPKYNVNYGRVGLEVGVKYKFGHKNSKGERTYRFEPAYTAYEYESLLEKLNNTKTDTVVVTNTVEVIRDVVREVEVEKPTYILMTPVFARGESNLDATSSAILDVFAKQMVSSDKDYVITGYASLEGTERFNTRLSLERAEAVRDALVQRGVSPERLTVVGGGATDEFGDRYEDNRIVVFNEK